jgi:glycosyltransferase involved in cell wall biosynthesis
VSKTTPVNARFLTQPLTGIQRYAWNIVQRLPSLRLITPKKPEAAYHSISSSRVLHVSHILPSHFWEQLVLPTAFTNQEVLWTPAGIGPFIAKHHVLTIHDLSMLEHPEWYAGTYARWYQLIFPPVARKARKIITVSQFCKHRIIQLLKIPADKIEVFYEGVDQQFHPEPAIEVQATLDKLGISKPYILAVGAVSARKNLSRLFEAWKIISSRTDEVSLVVIGSIGLSYSNVTSQIIPSRTVHLKGIGDQQLVHLYAGATAFVYPSLYEGFGLPVLESMAVGTPVIASRTTSLPEVAGDAAWFIDPYDIASIAAGIERVIDDSNLQEDLRQKGFQRVQQFSWDWTAEQTGNILQEVADSI